MHAVLNSNDAIAPCSKNGYIPTTDELCKKQLLIDTLSKIFLN
jgi:hypothetical protein